MEHMSNKSAENPIESNNKVLIKKAGNILRTGIAGGLVGIAVAGGASAQNYSQNVDTGIDQSNYAPAPVHNNKTVDLDNPVYTMSPGLEYTDTNTDKNNNNYTPTSTHDYGSVNFDYPTYNQTLESVDLNELLDRALRKLDRIETMDKTMEERITRLTNNLQKQTEQLQEILNGLNKALGRTSSVQSPDSIDHDKLIKSNLAESTRNIKEYILGEKNHPLIINDPTQYINKTAQDVTSSALGTIDNSVVSSELDQSVKSALDRLSTMGASQTKTAIPPELIQQIQYSVGSQTEPSQILQPDEIAQMEQQKALVDMVQVDLNKSFEKELVTSGKGNIALEFANLNPDTMKIFIKFADGDSTSVEASLSVFNNKHLLQKLVEDVVKQEIFLDSTPGNK